MNKSSSVEEAPDSKIKFLAPSIAANQFTVPLPTGKEIVRAVNTYDSNAELIKELVEALRLLITDVQDYEPWQRPCYALDAARAALAKADAQKGRE